jgi:hypothetical protein
MIFTRLVGVLVLSMVAAVPAAYADKPTGLSFGGFKLTPSLSLSATYDDNVYTQEANEKSDIITHIAPALTVQRGAAKRAVVFKAGAEQALYAQDSENNYLNYSASLKGRYQFDTQTSWDGFADYRRLHARRGDTLADPLNDASEPLPFDVMRAHMRLIHRLNDWELRPFAGIARYDYQDGRRQNGMVIDQDGRDRNEIKLGGQIRYALAKGFKLIFESHVMPHHYDEGGADARDSSGNSYMAGFEYRPSKSLWTEFMAGYLARTYDRAQYDDIDTVGFRGGVNWRYGDDHMFRLRLNRGTAEITETGAGGAIRTDLSASLSHQLTNDLTGELGAHYKLLDYQGGQGADNGRDDRKDHSYKLSAGLSYTLSDDITLQADYAHIDFDSNRAAAEYTNNIFSTGLRFDF